MKTTMIKAAAIGAAFLTVSGHAASALPLQPTFTSLIVFGDSLSDDGNLAAATSLDPALPTIPSAPYVGGRFSNGEIWADVLAAEFVDAKTYENFAFGGARAVAGGLASPDLFAQIGLFSAASPTLELGARPLASLWFGANDIIDAFDARDNPLDAANAAAAEVANGVAALSSQGFDDFLIFTLPNLGVAPLFAGTTAETAAGLASAAYNTALAVELSALALPDANFFTVDTDFVVSSILSDPESFGFDPTLLAEGCVDSTGFPPIPTPICDNPDVRPFFDNLHPTSAVHAEIAAAANSALAPAIIPLPASAVLLLGAIGALGVAAARRRASEVDAIGS